MEYPLCAGPRRWGERRAGPRNPGRSRRKNWATGFNVPGMSSGTSGTSVEALAVGPDGSLYAGGDFTTAGGVAANRIARWDGTAWHPLGSGMIQVVYALAVGPDGSLYAGGIVHHGRRGGGQPHRPLGWRGVAPPGQRNGRLCLRPGGGAGRLALRRGRLHHGRRGGGQQHRPLGRRGVAPPGQRDRRNYVRLCPGIWAGRLALCRGYFTTAGGVAANNIARWDGAAWHSLGGGMSGGSATTASTPWRLDRTARSTPGADFTTAGGVTANHIARWDGADVAPPGQRDGRHRSTPWRWAGWLALCRGLFHHGRRSGGQATSPAGMARHGIPWAAGWMDQRLGLCPGSGPDGSLYAGGLFHHSRRGGSQLYRPLGRPSSWHSLGGNGITTASAPWRLGRTARSTPGVVHHSRRSGGQPHRPLGRHGVAPPGQRDERRGHR